jgi:NAD(P)-dependent dehydrogenase (short-subunit alcohol dehydrogenase family)
LRCVPNLKILETRLKIGPSPQTVLITGAASGIGRAAAWIFAEAGGRCVLVDHDTHALQKVTAALSAPELHQLREVDLRDLGR